MAVMEFDERATQRLERTYATPDVVAQRVRVRALLALRPGERVLDVGSGPGYLLAEMADEVGPGGAVQGVDPSEAMNAVAARRCADRPWVQVGSGFANALPAADGTVDAVVSTQVYEYVADMPGALAEVHRVLRPGGRVLVLDTDWQSVVWQTSDAERHRRVMTAWDEHLVDPYLPRRLSALLRDAGFTVTDRVVVPLLNAEWDEDTYSANILRLIEAYVPGRGGVGADEARAWAEDLRGRPDYFFSLNRYAFVATR